MRWTITLHVLEAIEFMTVRWAHLRYELLETASKHIINEISVVSRVTCDVSSNPRLSRHS